MVLLDTSVLALAFDSSFKAPLDPTTGLELTDTAARVNNLIGALNKKKERILLATPVLAEYFVRGGPDMDKRMQLFSSSRFFTIVNFDVRAALECALLNHPDNIKASAKDDEGIARAKLKFDRQIVAIAIANGVHTIYTGDLKLANCAKRNGIDATMTWEIPLPISAAQKALDFTSLEAASDIAGSW